MPSKTSPLGKVGVSQFLEHYWQKRPLLIRAAFPGFTGFLSPAELFRVARREDAEARLVSSTGRARWALNRGPFSIKDFKRSGRWTVLVQGVNLMIPEADRLLRQFDFLPYARLDDLMISYATDGGGVGPHQDNYDVFLLQGMGRRRWRIGPVRDSTIHEHLPLRILKHFQPAEDWVLEPGDMLYLPPEWAHEGSAVGECMTYSVGFRASPKQELAEGFLTYLQDRIELPGRYEDPGLRRQAHAAEIGSAMIEQVIECLQGIRWSKAMVRDFLGCHLTEPKPQVFFEPPRSPMSRTRFRNIAEKNGVRLDLRTQLLFAGNRYFINGEIADIPAQARSYFRMLADRREAADVSGIKDSAIDLLYQWYLDGFLEPR